MERERLSTENEENIAVIQRITERVYDKIKRWRESEVWYLRDVVDDTRILRFYRGYGFDEDKAVEKLLEMVEFRIEHNVDEIRRDIVENNLEPKDFPFHMKMHGGFPTILEHNKARDGLPVSILRLGCSNLEKLKEIEIPDLIKGHIYNQECMCMKLDKISKERKEMWRFYCIIDLKGLTLSTVTSRLASKLLKITGDITQKCYPESLERCYVINAPSVFTVGWKMIKPWYPKRIIDKIRILGSGFLKEIEKDVDPELLPALFNGGCTCANCLQIHNMCDVMDSNNRINVSAGTSENVDIHMDGHEIAMYNIKPEKNDIEFSVCFKPDKEGEPEKIVIDKQRVAEMSDSFKSSIPGTLTFTFDNSYSRFRKKSVFVDIHLVADDVFDKLEKDLDGIEF
eukprot:TRINITY_DN1560_c0_g1_i1.p1 TRINITY_DN1560_c0_g1~~TRINITY_DN1560_c0_g1_i1.p1  ORF type:complete len:398 (-),score=118.84 TRINITY_DN1560_c0_g1_i1:44-1237(-)